MGLLDGLKNATQGFRERYNTPGGRESIIRGMSLLSGEPMSKAILAGNAASEGLLAQQQRARQLENIDRLRGIYKDDPEKLALLGVAPNAFATTQIARMNFNDLFKNVDTSTNNPSFGTNTSSPLNIGMRAVDDVARGEIGTKILDFGKSTVDKLLGTDFSSGLQDASAELGATNLKTKSSLRRLLNSGRLSNQQYEMINETLPSVDDTNVKFKAKVKKLPGLLNIQKNALTAQLKGIELSGKQSELAEIPSIKEAIKQIEDTLQYYAQFNLEGTLPADKATKEALEIIEGGF